MTCSGLAPAVPLSPLGASLTVSLGLRFRVMAVLAVQGTAQDRFTRCGSAHCPRA